MITEEKYLEAKKITDEYEKQLNITLVMWRCTKDLFMDVGGKAFTKNRLYKQLNQNCYSALNDFKEEHSFGEWRKYFVAT